MAKTANDLCFGDIVYEPIVEGLIERKVSKVEKDITGIKVGFDSYSYDIKNSDSNAAISTKITFNVRKHFLYIRKEEALIKQREMRIRELKLLQKKANDALTALNDFTLKYFTDENPIQ